MNTKFEYEAPEADIIYFKQVLVKTDSIVLDEDVFPQDTDANAAAQDWVSGDNN